MREDKLSLSPARGAAYFSRPLLLAASAILGWGAAERSTGPVWIGGALVAGAVLMAALVAFGIERRNARQSRARCG